MSEYQDQVTWFEVQRRVVYGSGRGGWWPIRHGDADTRELAEAYEYFYKLGHPEATTRVAKRHGLPAERQEDHR